MNVFDDNYLSRYSPSHPSRPHQIKYKNMNGLAWLCPKIVYKRPNAAPVKYRYIVEWFMVVTCSDGPHDKPNPGIVNGKFMFTLLNMEKSLYVGQKGAAFDLILCDIT